MKKIVLISTYFGKFPEYFNLWLKSAGNNSDIDFLIYSDCDTKGFLPLPENVKIKYTTFEEVKNLFQSKFDFKITLNTPYKLCDYKPAYGYAFKDDISQYDYWGHIDIDMIIGDLRSFLPKDDFEKIYQFGHLCLYKNTEQNNCRFMCDVGMKYKDVFTTENIMVFDEIQGMQKKYNLLKIPTYISRDFADITKRRDRFTLTDFNLTPKELKTNNYDYQIFYYQDKKVYRDYIENGEMKTQEFNYIHFSSRKMPDNTNGCENFYITNKGFFQKSEKTTKEIIEKYNHFSPAKDKITALKWRKNDAIRKVKKIMQERKESK